MYSLEFLQNSLSKWNNLIKKIHVSVGNDKYMTIMGKSINWKLAEQYPACQNLDLHDYIYFKNKSPSFIVFTFNVQKNLGVCLFPEERNKATSRSLKFNRLTYSGPTIILGKDGKRTFLDFYMTCKILKTKLKRVKIKLKGGLAFKPISITL